MIEAMNNQPEAKPAAMDRDAIIFIPGLSSGLVDQSVDAISRRIRSALDRNAQTGKARFVLQEGQDEDYSEDRKTRLRTILRRDASGDTPLVDIYELKYAETLTKTLAESSPLGQIVSLGRVLAGDFVKLLASVRRRGKSLRQKLQLWWLSFIMLLVTLYGVLLVVAAFGAGLQVWSELSSGPGGMAVSTPAAAPERKAAAEGNAVPASGDSTGIKTQEGAPPAQAHGAGKPPDAKDPGAQSWMQKIKALPWDKWSQWSQWIVVIFAALAGLTKKQVKDMLGSAAAEYVCARDYIAIAGRKAAIAGQLAALLEHIVEKDLTYRKIHIVSYSFGSLVAIDSMFPNIPPGKRFEQIDTLVTIGCPFDLVRTYWPAYFKDRMKPDRAPKKWMNVYSPLDVLGSNFRDDQKHGNAGVGVELTEAAVKTVKPVNLCFGRGMELPDLAPADLILMVGFRAHTSYLGDPEGTSISCFDLLVPHLFDSEGALR